MVNAKKPVTTGDFGMSLVNNRSSSEGSLRDSLIAGSLLGGEGVTPLDYQQQRQWQGTMLSDMGEVATWLLQAAGLCIAVPGLILYVGAERLGSAMYRASTALEKLEGTLTKYPKLRLTCKIIRGVFFLSPPVVLLRAGIGAVALLGAGGMRLGLGDEKFRQVIFAVDGGTDEGFARVVTKITKSLKDIGKAYTPEKSSDYGDVKKMSAAAKKNALGGNRHWLTDKPIDREKL